MIMASVGIYAVIAHAASRRTREIGVRMALGASTRNILGLIMRRGMWQIACGVVLGLAAAIPVSRLMGTLPLASAGSNPLLFACIASTLATVGILACWLPARRAARLNPVKAIRYE
jgi:ABC-type antimicrobial peptide transport system permease subunit